MLRMGSGRGTIGRRAARHGVNAHPLRAISTLAALASALAACVTTEPSSPAAAGPAPATEPPPSAYVRMLRSHGVETAIPARGKFILVNIPSFELIALQDGVPVLRSRVVVGRECRPFTGRIDSLGRGG